VAPKIRREMTMERVTTMTMGVTGHVSLEGVGRQVAVASQTMVRVDDIGRRVSRMKEGILMKGGRRDREEETNKRECTYLFS
jgi:hypothetical protein